MNLVRKPDGKYVIIYGKGENKYFDNVDQACDFLQDVLLVSEEAIDTAVIAMSTNSHNWAIFTNDGRFSHTEQE